MKQGKTFEEVVEQVNEEAAMRRDYYCPSNEMMLMSDSTGSRLASPSGQFEMRDTAHLHLAELCGIDRRYYQKMRTESPFLLDRNVNHWLTTSTPKQRIVRAHNSEARAIVSSRYAMLDNDALLRTIEPIIEELGLSVESCDVSDEKLLIKMVSPRLTGAVKVNDHVQAGLIVRNSEVRCSAVEVDWFVKRLVCLNGMVCNGPNGRGAFRRHVGRDWNMPRRKSRCAGSHNGASLNGSALNGNSRSAGLPSGGLPPFGLIPGNIEREDWERSIWNDLQNALRSSLNASAFTDLLERLSFTTTLKTRLQPDKLVERVGEDFHLSPGEQTSVLYHMMRDPLMRDEDLTLWGLLNAVTRTAEDIDDYGRATELEELGGRLTHLTPRAWSRLISPN